MSNKLVEKYDDNPGAYFNMLVEGLNEAFDEVYASVMRQASKDARQLRDAWEKEGKSLSSTLSSLGYIRDDPRSVYMYKESDGGNAIVFNLEPIEDFKNYVEYFVVDENDRIPRGWTSTRLVIDFWKDNDTEEDSYEYDESLKEDYYDKRLVQKLYNMWFSKEQAEWLAKNAKDYAESLAYGHTTTDDLIEAEEYVNSKMKKQEAIKEDKFVSRDKMSKKDRKELDSQKRNTWGNTNPVTRVQPNKKAYDRKRDKKELDESSSTFEKVLKEEDGKIFMDTVGKKLIILGNGMQHLSGNERIKFDDIVYYYKLLEDAYKAYGDYLKNSNSLKLRPWNYEDTTWNYPDDYYGDYFN